MEPVRKGLLRFVPGVLLIAVAAAMWGTDGILRAPLVENRGIPAGVVVLVEHAILVLITLPFLRGVGSVLRSLTGADWISLLLIGVGASAVATALFTQSFTYGEINTTILLQKLQPVVVLFAAWLVLGERPLRRYWIYFAFAVGGAWLLTFPDPDNVEVAKAAPALYALGAAVLWGLGTVLGRRLVPKIEFKQLTALRFLIGLPAAAAVVTVQWDWNAVANLRWVDFFDPATSLEGGTLPTGLIMLAAVPGFIALLTYYRGLRTTRAMASTLAELALPAAALTLNHFYRDRLLGGPEWLGIGSQWWGLGILLVAIVGMSIAVASQRDETVGIEAGEPVLVPEPA